MISLSSILQMRHGLLKKKREKMACPRSMTQKKTLDTEGPRKKINIVILPCPHVIQIKGREIHKKEYSISTIHLPHMCTILINMFDLSSPWIFCLILQYMWHKCMLPFFLPCAPHKPSLEVGWKEAKPWWYTQWATREILWRSKSYGWSLQKYFQNPRHMAGKWRRLKSIPFRSSTSQAIHGRNIKIHRQM